MKVIAWFKDGSFSEIEVPKECEEHGPAYAIEKAKEKIANQATWLAGVDHWEVEEDFL